VATITKSPSWHWHGGRQFLPGLLAFCWHRGLLLVKSRNMPTIIHCGESPMRPHWFTLASVFVIFAIALTCQAEDKAPEGFTPLFNGKDLTGWKVNKEATKPKVWGAEKGVLYVQGSGGGWLMTEKEYSNFELRLEFKMPHKGNSGVALRSKMDGNPSFESGMEIQLLDDEWHKKNYKGLKDTQLTGSIYGVVPPSKDALKPVGEWNQMRITAKGSRITVELNGEKIVNADLRDHKDKVKDHKGMMNPKGHLGLQSHDGRVEFQNLYVKELTD
jgi:hypothetical protein